MGLAVLALVLPIQGLPAIIEMDLDTKVANIPKLSHLSSSVYSTKKMVELEFGTSPRRNQICFQLPSSKPVWCFESLVSRG